MPDKGTNKKLTRVGGDEISSSTSGKEPKMFVASDESKAKAGKFRLFAVICWIIAIGFEAAAIYILLKTEIDKFFVWMIVLIAADLIFAVAGSLLWKQANRFDPASEKDRIRFFIQNQLGVLIAMIAFLPLVILIFTNKNMNGKQKGIIGSIAVIALIIAGITGVDFNPPSVEQYTEQTEKVKQLNDGVNNVFWTKSGKSYHLYSDCSYINSDRTTEIFQGTVAKARELKNITDLCARGIEVGLGHAQ